MTAQFVPSRPQILCQEAQVSPAAPLVIPFASGLVLAALPVLLNRHGHPLQLDLSGRLRTITYPGFGKVAIHTATATAIAAAPQTITHLTAAAGLYTVIMRVLVNFIAPTGVETVQLLAGGIILSTPIGGFAAGLDQDVLGGVPVELTAGQTLQLLVNNGSIGADTVNISTHGRTEIL